MAQDQATIDQNHKKFIQQVVETELVWGLETEDGFATSSSMEYEDADVIAFWSDEASAAACAGEDWAEYTPASIPLGDFLENWCIGMQEDGLLAGTNWDTDLTGTELEPLDLALEILDALKAKGKKVQLQGFASQEIFAEELKKAWEETEGE
jgi:hypothetical protein